MDYLNDRNKIQSRNDREELLLSAITREMTSHPDIRLSYSINFNDRIMTLIRSDSGYKYQQLPEYKKTIFYKTTHNLPHCGQDPGILQDRRKTAGEKMITNRAVQEFINSNDQLRVYEFPSRVKSRQRKYIHQFISLLNRQKIETDLRLGKAENIIFKEMAAILNRQNICLIGRCNIDNIFVFKLQLVKVYITKRCSICEITMSFNITSDQNTIVCKSEGKPIQIFAQDIQYDTNNTIEKSINEMQYETEELVEEEVIDVVEMRNMVQLDLVDNNNSFEILTCNPYEADTCEESEYVNVLQDENEELREEGEVIDVMEMKDIIKLDLVKEEEKKSDISSFSFETRTEHVVGNTLNKNEQLTKQEETNILSFEPPSPISEEPERPGDELSDPLNLFSNSGDESNEVDIQINYDKEDQLVCGDLSYVIAEITPQKEMIFEIVTETVNIPKDCEKPLNNEEEVISQDIFEMIDNENQEYGNSSTFDERYLLIGNNDELKGREICQIEEMRHATDISDKLNISEIHIFNTSTDEIHKHTGKTLNENEVFTKQQTPDMFNYDEPLKNVAHEVCEPFDLLFSNEELHKIHTLVANKEVRCDSSIVNEHLLKNGKNLQNNEGLEMVNEDDMFVRTNKYIHNYDKVYENANLSRQDEELCDVINSINGTPVINPAMQDNLVDNIQDFVEKENSTGKNIHKIEEYFKQCETQRLIQKERIDTELKQGASENVNENKLMEYNINIVGENVFEQQPTSEPLNLQVEETAYNNMDFNNGNWPRNVIIVHYNYPAYKITSDSATLLQSIIYNAIKRAGELPCLKCYGIRNGGIVYSCHDAKSYKWLHDQISCYYRILNYDIALNDTHIIEMKINSFIKVDVDIILNNIEAFYSDIKTFSWKVIQEKIFTDYCIITFEVDDDSLTVIKKEEYSLFVGFDKAEISVMYD